MRDRAIARQSQSSTRFGIGRTAKVRARTHSARETRAVKWHLVWLLRARPMAAMASAVSGVRVVYDKEGIDPGERHPCHILHSQKR